MNNSLITLLSALAGGLLTIIGGFVGNYFSQSLSRRSEKRKLYREKIEEIYTLATQVKEWYDFVDNLRAIPSRDIIPPCPIDRVIMLTRLYTPELSSSATVVGKSIEDTSKRFLEWCQGGSSVLIDRLFDMYYQELLRDIETVSRKYL